MLSTDAEPLPMTAEDYPAKPNNGASGPPKSKDSIHNEGGSSFLMPEELFEFYDACILYTGTDYNAVTDLLASLKNSLVLQNGEVPKIDLFDVISPNGDLYSQLEELIQKCSCIIIYLTKAFFEDSHLHHQSNEILINSIDKSTRPENLQIMLLLSENLVLPFGLKSLINIKLYINREHAFRKIKISLQIAQKMRKMKERLFANSGRPTLKVENLTRTPTFQNKPVTVNINVNATNVMIGDHNQINVSNASNASNASSDSEDEGLGDCLLQSVDPNRLPISATREGNYECNLSKNDVQLSTISMTAPPSKPGSTSDSLD